jgi:hypothetical protein
MADVNVLRDAGMDIDSLPEDQKSALSRLSQDELDTLASIRAKLNEEPEVSGHMRPPVAGDGNLVW